jgi:hypothetical protein
MIIFQKMIPVEYNSKIQNNLHLVLDFFPYLDSFFFPVLSTYIMACNFITET